MEWVPFAVGGFLGALILTQLFIRAMRWAGSGQPIREYGPKIHEHKRGTPTMGGAILLIVFLGTLLLYQLIRGALSAQGLLLVGVTLGFGLIGLLDDVLKFLQQHSQGLRARYKLLLQVLVSGAFVAALNAWGVLDSTIQVPFSSVEWTVDPRLLSVLVVLVFVGTVNAVNLTDGLDGLAAGVTLVLLAAYGVILYGASVAGDLFQLVLIFGSVLLGFLWFNVHPARIFLGDTGSLALGGFVAALSVLTGTELILLVLAFVPVVEALSVIAQVTSFRLFKRRIFKVSPLHHHFERAEGIDYPYLIPSVEWPEWAITLLFWTISAVFAVIGLVAYFWR
jgi:phospho-N-acetylmuramoyl-pentapeptide-transferase